MIYQNTQTSQQKTVSGSNVKLVTIFWFMNDIVSEGLIQHLGDEIEFLCQIFRGPCHLTPSTRWHVTLFYKIDLIYVKFGLHIR